MTNSDEPTFQDCDDSSWEPPAYVCTVRLSDVLADLTDDELSTWPDQIVEREHRRRRMVSTDSGAS